MHLIYDGIEMECLELEEFHEEMVYDDTNTDYLYSRISIQGQFLINGQSQVASVTPVTSYDIDPGKFESLQQLWSRTAPDSAKPSLPVGGGPTKLNNAAYGKVRTEEGPFRLTVTDGIYATGTEDQTVPLVIKKVVPCVNTHTVIRNRLSAPRGRLFVFTGKGDPGRKDEMLLMSPSDWRSHTDCKNGPTPKLLSVNSFHGDAQTFVVSWGVETFINEMSSVIQTGNPNAPVTQTGNPLLSNRFTMRHVIDADSYLAIAVQGTAIFRTDLLYRNPPINPDDIRLRLFLPVPFGCVREHIDIQALPDGSGVTYSFLDVQAHSNFVAGPFANATHIEAIHRQAIALDEDALSGALHAYERFYSLRANRKFASDEASGKKTPPPSPPPAPPARGIRTPRP